MVRAKKGIDNSLAAIKSIRAARPDGERVYVILDNLNAHKGKKILAWCAKHNVELCFTPTYSSWANPISVYRLSADRRARMKPQARAGKPVLTEVRRTELSPEGRLIECHFGPLRDFVLNNSDHPSHVVLTGRLHAYLRWRNTHDADPAMRARLRRERARLRSERQRRWGRPATVAPPEPVAA